MFKLTILVLTVVLCFSSLSCQQYSTGLQQSVARADETAATAALRTVAVAQRSYAASSGGDFGTFQQLCEGGYLDSRFNSSKPTVKDYVLTMEVAPKREGHPEGFFSCNADPAPASGKAGSHFYIDSTAPGLHVNPNDVASAKDPLVQP